MKQHTHNITKQVAVIGLLTALAMPVLAAADKPASTNAEVIYSLGQIDQMPRMSGLPKAPIFPFALRNAGIQSGKITVQFVVGANGKVRDAEWFTTSHPGFINAGTEAVKKLQFSPARKGGKNVAVRLAQPFEFGSGEEAKGNNTKSTKPTKPGVNDFSDFPEIGGFIIHNAAVAVDKKPEAQDGNAAPVAPQGLGGVKGKARILYIMDTNGTVIYARAVSANNEVWRETCEAAVLKWKFSPAIKAGKSVYCGMETEFATN